MQNEAVEPTKGLWKIIAASSAGTLIEWYDFYLFGSLAAILATQFFPQGNPTAALLSTLATFATGFLVRPFGAIVFGRMGDIVGRKNTFLLTLGMMGAATVALGLVPKYDQIGVLAPILLVCLRLVQGLAIGGEYGGAAIYVAEHSPPHRKGYFTSYIQTTATLGLLVSLIVILATRSWLGEKVFNDWGWRVPFILSAVLVLLSYAIRSRMSESPIFARLKEEGKTSPNPLKESFTDPANRRLVLIALFGVMAGQAVVWYTSQFYALLFLKNVLNIESKTSDQIVAIALLLGTPFYIVFGALSDKIGRKKIIMSGLALAVVFYIPLFWNMQRVATINQYGDDSTFDAHLERSIDPVTHAPKAVLVAVTKREDGAVQTERTPMDPKNLKQVLAKEPKKIVVEPTPAMSWMLVLFVWMQVIFATLAYAPVAAFLVEMFPARIRYTSLSVPYHLGNGIFGGFVPLIATALVAQTHLFYAGAFFPMAIAGLSLIVANFFIHEKPTDAGFAEETT